MVAIVPPLDHGSNAGWHAVDQGAASHKMICFGDAVTALTVSVAAKSVDPTNERGRWTAQAKDLPSSLFPVLRGGRIRSHQGLLDAGYGRCRRRTIGPLAQLFLGFSPRRERQPGLCLGGVQLAEHFGRRQRAA